MNQTQQTGVVELRLKQDREKSVLRRHPWVFSGAIERVPSVPSCTAVAEVFDCDGDWIARGLYNPAAELPLRICTWNQDEPVDFGFFVRRIDAAIELRRLHAASAGTDSYRLVHSEADGIPGLTVDRYADALVVRVSTRALTPFLGEIVAHLVQATSATSCVVEANPDEIAREELDADTIGANTVGKPGTVRILQDGLLFDVDTGAGQKTGFYLDQRENRSRVAVHAGGKRVLSAYCYTGAFEVYAAKKGASEITGLDGSEPALEHARKHLSLNGCSIPATYNKADVPVALRRFRDERRTFDMIVLDPPRFIFSRAQKEKGMRAYKDVNLLAMKLLSAGGILATFSCSGLVSHDDFTTIAQWAAIDSGRNVRILETLGQPPDHPVLATFPESSYLKGLICQVE